MQQHLSRRSRPATAGTVAAAPPQARMCWGGGGLLTSGKALENQLSATHVMPPSLATQRAQNPAPLQTMVVGHGHDGAGGSWNMAMI